MAADDLQARGRNFVAPERRIEVERARSSGIARAVDVDHEDTVRRDVAGEPATTTVAAAAPTPPAAAPSNPPASPVPAPVNDLAASPPKAEAEPARASADTEQAVASASAIIKKKAHGAAHRGNRKRSARAH
jgi:hypothetical protein